ncbi:MAG: Mov34/MPN/PAD-1 family protein [Candidatus Thermoplasmatota archaeon]
MWFFKKKRNRKRKNSTRKPWKITRRCLNLILENSKDSYPNEFGAMLRVDEKNKNIITELVMLPGTLSGSSHAIFKMHMKPIDFSLVGTVHSHPSSSNHPSRADVEFFRKHGKIHIIAAYPFNKQSWQSYDYNGTPVEIEVI